MNAINNKLLEQFSSSERKMLKEEYNNSMKERGKKHIARSVMFQKAYTLKTIGKEKGNRNIVEEEVPENYIDYGNYRIVWGEMKDALFSGSIDECLNNKKYGYLICKVLYENEIDIYEYDKVSIMGVK
jgi:hypothetical protein